jgi:hypothetical protein
MSDDLSGGPHLLAAFLCEKVLREPDGVFSFIRVVDRFIRPKPSAIPAGAQVLPIQVMLVASFKSGGIPAGNYKIKIRAHRPDPAAPLLMEMDHELFVEGGPDHGLAVINPVVMNLDEEGLYWIDVLFEDQMATRIPFRVIFASTPGMQKPPKSPGV